MAVTQSTFVQQEIAGDDLDDARVLYEGGYNGGAFALERTDQPFRYRYTAVGDDHVTLRTSTFMGHGRGRIEPEGEYIVTWMTMGGGLVDIGRDEVVAEIGRPVMFPTGRSFAFEYADGHQNLVHVDAAFLEAIAAERHGGAAVPLRFLHAAVPGPQQLAGWKRVLTASAPVVLDPASPALLRGAASRNVAVALLDTFAHEPLRMPAGIRSPRAARARIAVEFVHANAQLPITVADIAEAAGLTPRALQQTFRDHVGASPLEYLRQVRLEHAHDELLRLDPMLASVAAIAHRWGFVHLGRFAGEYAKRYGESPSRTLRAVR